jgi:hypothetical protein
LFSLATTISGSPIQHLLTQSMECYQGQSLENPASILLSQSNSGPQLSLI